MSEWREEKLKDCVKSRKGKKPQSLSETQLINYVPYIDIKAFETGEIRQYAEQATSNLASDEDILIVWDGARSGLAGKGFHGAIGSTLAAIKSDIIDKDYLFHFLRKNYNYINSNGKGTGIPHVDPAILWNIDIPIPSTIEEQQRIVSRLEERLARLSTAREKLDKIPLIIKRFRQSVLASACSGELTASWREGKDLPEWKNATIADIIKPKGQLFDGPFGSNLKTSDYVKSGVRVVRLENVGKLNFIEEKETFVTEDKFQSLRKHEVFENDIIFSSFIADGVRVCLIPKLETKAIAKADCFCLRPDKTKGVNKYICYALSNPELFYEFMQMLHGATRPRINTTQLKTIPFPLPPIPEQEEIIRRVDKIFSKADSIEQRYIAAKEKLDRAEKALYAKAFKGEL